MGKEGEREEGETSRRGLCPYLSTTGYQCMICLQRLLLLFLPSSSVFGSEVVVCMSVGFFLNTGH